VDAAVKELILTDAPLNQIEDVLMRQGGQTLGQAALLKSAEGTIPYSEALGIIGLDALGYEKAGASEKTAAPDVNVGMPEDGTV
jgi:hypothetical protein